MKRNSRLVGLDFMCQKYLHIKFNKFCRWFNIYPNNMYCDILFNLDNDNVMKIYGLSSDEIKDLKFFRHKLASYEK